MTDVSAPVPGEVYAFPVERIGKVAACQSPRTPGETTCWGSSKTHHWPATYN